MTPIYELIFEMLKNLGCSNEASKHIISVIKKDDYQEKMKSFLDELKDFSNKK